MLSKIKTLFFSQIDKCHCINEYEKYFSKTYKEARKKFINYAKLNECNIASIPLKYIKGINGEKLYIDIAICGNLKSKNILIYSSGIHGVEGYIGSAVQCNILDKYLPKNVPTKSAIIFIHAVNPYGMSHYRRWNSNNVDLNRNFGSKLDQKTNIYSEISSFLNPIRRPWNWYLYFIWNFIKQYIFKWRKISELKQAIVGGQNSKSKGLFYTGTKMEIETEELVKWIKKYVKYGKYIVHIDLHSGLGKFNKDIMIPYPENINSGNLNLFFKSKIKFPYKTTNSFSEGLHKMCFPKTKFSAFTQEFGTYSNIYILKKLIEENYYTHHKNIDHDHKSRKNLLNAFYPDNKIWRQNALINGIKVYEIVKDFILS